MNELSHRPVDDFVAETTEEIQNKEMPLTRRDVLVMVLAGISLATAVTLGATEFKDELTTLGSYVDLSNVHGGIR